MNDQGVSLWAKRDRSLRITKDSELQEPKTSRRVLFDMLSCTLQVAAIEASNETAGIHDPSS